jgi:hypothetical protein
VIVVASEERDLRIIASNVGTPLEGGHHGRYKSLLMEKRFFSDIVEGDYVAIEVERLNCQERILRDVTGIRLIPRVVGRKGTRGSLLGGRFQEGPGRGLGRECWWWWCLGW